jgi:Fe-S cluster biogenesis protein NfuA
MTCKTEHLSTQMGMDDSTIQILQILDLLRPAMQADGGDVELVAVEDRVVFVKLHGTCLACPSATLTIKYGIERVLKERIPWIAGVIRII